MGDESDILVFYDGSSEEISNYLQGFLFCAYLAVALFLVWSIFLCIFMCCGRRRVGFLSGRSFVIRPQRKYPSDKEGTDHVDESSWQEDNEETSSPMPTNRQGCTLAEPLCSFPNIVRCVFVVVSVLVMITAILFVSKGLLGLQDSVDTYHSNAVRLQQISRDGRSLMNQGSNAVRQTADLLQETLTRESNPSIFCPGDPSLQNSNAARQAFSYLSDAVEAVNYVKEFEETDVQDLQERLSDLEKELNDAEQELDQFEFFNGGAKTLLALYIIIPLSLIAATIMAMFGKQSCFLTQLIQWVWVPIFILLTLWFVLLAMGLPIVGGINSDFCLPYGEGSSPDDLIFRVLENEGYQYGDLTYDTAEYFIRNQCQYGESPFEPLQSYMVELVRDKRTTCQSTPTLFETNLVHSIRNDDV